MLLGNVAQQKITGVVAQTFSSVTPPVSAETIKDIVGAGHRTVPDLTKTVYTGDDPVNTVAKLVTALGNCPANQTIKIAAGAYNDWGHTFISTAINSDVSVDGSAATFSGNCTFQTNSAFEFYKWTFENLVITDEERRATIYLYSKGANGSKVTGCSFTDSAFNRSATWDVVTYQADNVEISDCQFYNNNVYYGTRWYTSAICLGNTLDRSLCSTSCHAHHNTMIMTGYDWLSNGINCIRVGLSGNPMVDSDGGNARIPAEGSHIVEYNFIDGWNTEPELLEIKSNNNLIKCNVMMNCPDGHISNRAGHNNVYHGNYYDGCYRGFRFFGTGHVFVYNYLKLSPVITAPGFAQPCNGYEWNSSKEFDNSGNQVGEETIIQHNVSDGFTYWWFHVDSPDVQIDHTIQSEQANSNDIIENIFVNGTNDAGVGTATGFNATAKMSFANWSAPILEEVADPTKANTATGNINIADGLDHSYWGTVTINGAQYEEPAWWRSVVV